MIDAFEPRIITDPTEMAAEPLYACAYAFLDAWMTQNYGEMASNLTNFSSADSHQKTAGLVRDQFSHVELEEFRIIKLDFKAVASCDVEAQLRWNDQQHRCRLHWIKEDGEGKPDIAGDLGARWHVMSFGPHGMIDEPSPD